MAQAPDAVNEAESKKFEQEFEEYQKKLKEQKDQWAKENPDQVKPDTDEWDSWFSEQDKELQQIFQGQSEMKNHLLELTRKMDDIIRRQERTMSMIGVIIKSQKCIFFFFGDEVDYSFLTGRPGGSFPRRWRWRRPIGGHYSPRRG